MNIGVHVSLSDLVSLVCMPRSGIAGSHGSSISSFYFFVTFLMCVLSFQFAISDPSFLGLSPFLSLTSVESTSITFSKITSVFLFFTFLELLLPKCWHLNLYPLFLLNFIYIFCVFSCLCFFLEQLFAFKFLIHF